MSDRDLARRVRRKILLLGSVELGRHKKANMEVEMIIEKALIKVREEEKAKVEVNMGNPDIPLNVKITFLKKAGFPNFSDLLRELRDKKKPPPRVG